MSRQRKAICPRCDQLRAVRGDGKFSRHGRVIDGKAYVRGQGRREIELCPGSDRPAGLW